MGEASKIEWTDHTFNPWWGCAKVSPGCDHCYAESLAKRVFPSHGLWGIVEGGSRRVFEQKHWNEPLKWNTKAEVAGVRQRVFCASMADVFDNHRALPDERDKLWTLIHKTPHLDWLILTKRIGNVGRMVPPSWMTGHWPANSWLGISVVNQHEVDRDVPKLIAMPAEVRFLSCEPLLGPIWIGEANLQPAIDWVICGGESGHRARPMAREWADSLRSQCAVTNTAFFMKQGSQANWPNFKDFATFPSHLQVRQWPVMTAQQRD